MGQQGLSSAMTEELILSDTFRCLIIPSISFLKNELELAFKKLTKAKFYNK